MRASGPVLLGNPILWRFAGGLDPLPPPSSGSAHVIASAFSRVNILMRYIFFKKALPVTDPPPPLENELENQTRNHKCCFKTLVSPLFYAGNECFICSPTR